MYMCVVDDIIAVYVYTMDMIGAWLWSCLHKYMVELRK